MTPAFTLRQLQYFVAVSEAGSVARAAEKVHVTAATISAAIATLERQFGVQLFVRQRAQALTPSAAGRRLLGEARALLRRAEQLQAGAAELGEAVQGELAVGCLTTLVPTLLPGLRRAFEDRYPAVQVRQRADHQAALIEALRRGEIELALTWAMAIPDDLAFTALAAAAPTVLLAPAHPLAERTVLRVEDVAEHPMVLLDLPISRDYFGALFSREGLRPRIAERVGDADALRSMVANGFGYGLLNQRLCSPLAADGKALLQRPLATEAEPLRLGLASARGDWQPRRVGAFIEIAAAAVAADPRWASD